MLMQVNPTSPANNLNQILQTLQVGKDRSRNSCLINLFFEYTAFSSQQQSALSFTEPE